MDGKEFMEYLADTLQPIHTEIVFGDERICVDTITPTYDQHTHQTEIECERVWAEKGVSISTRVAFYLENITIVRFNPVRDTQLSIYVAGE